MLYFVDPIRPVRDLLAGGRQAKFVRHTHAAKIRNPGLFYESGTSGNSANWFCARLPKKPPAKPEQTPMAPAVTATVLTASAGTACAADMPMAAPYTRGVPY